MRNIVLAEEVVRVGQNQGIFSKIEQDNCFIIQKIDNKSQSFSRHFLQFSLPHLTKLRISQIWNIRYVRMTNIESNMTIFGQCDNLSNTE